MEALLFPNFFIFAGIWVILSTVAVGCMIGAQWLLKKLTREPVIGSYLEG